MDGGAADFGNKFWKVLAEAAPLAIAAVRDKGVSEAVYTDRYLLTPLNFRLLLEVTTAMPGKTSDTRIQISTARLDRPEQVGYRFWDPFSEDRQREDVLRQLFQVTPAVTPKSQQPHGRSLVLNLTDGRRLTILLDQGFGAWRTDGLVRHDFRLPPQKQGAEIRRADIRVRLGERLGCPIILEFG